MIGMVHFERQIKTLCCMVHSLCLCMELVLCANQFIDIYNYFSPYRFFNLNKNIPISDCSKQNRNYNNELTRKGPEENILCPHKSVLYLPPIPTAEQARDQMKLS